MSYDKLNVLVENVRAIELAMKIRLQGRRATESEREVLSRYSGFGGIKEVLNIGTNNPIEGRMAEPMQLSLFGDLFGDAVPAPAPNGNTAIISLDASGMEVCTIEIMTDGRAAKADIMVEPVAFKRIDRPLY